MDGLDGDHVVTPTVTSRNNRGAVFSVRCRCRRFITDTANHLQTYIRGLNLAVVKPTTVQVTKLPL
jgi:hypothetical protein